MMTRYVLGRATRNPVHLRFEGSDKTLCGLPVNTLQPIEEENPDLFPPCRLCARIERIAKDWGITKKAEARA